MRALAPLSMGRWGWGGGNTDVGQGESSGGGEGVGELQWSSEGFRGNISAPGTRRASFFDHSPPVPVFAPPHQTIWRTVSKNLAHPLHPVCDDGKGGGWKWWE